MHSQYFYCMGKISGGFEKGVSTHVVYTDQKKSQPAFECLDSTLIPKLWMLEKSKYAQTLIIRMHDNYLMGTIFKAG